MKRIVIALVAVLAFTGTALAAPGPADDAAGDPGPPDSLPDPVPDFVGDILGAIGQFLSGGIDSLGKTVSGIAGGGG
ncbi:MAG: hypothetical protein ABEH35_08490 [Haloarculaceae archaeon]